MTRRYWLQAVAIGAACFALQAARKEFWDTKDPANWSTDEKQELLYDSPWARDGFARMDVDKKKPPRGGYPTPMPDTRPGMPPGGAQSVPIGGDVPPPPPKPGGQPVQFRVLARWETAKPVRLAGGPEVPDMTGEFYVIRLRGLPLMPPPKPKPGEEPPPDPNQGMLQAIKVGTRLVRKDKPDIPCAHLFTGTGNAVTDVLLFFPRGPNPITPADKQVTLESQFALFDLSIKFPLKDMMYKGVLAL